MKKPRCSILGILRYGVVLISIFALWWFFRSYLFFLMLILVVFTPGISAAALYKRRDGLWAEAELPTERIGRNCPVNMKIWTENQSRVLPFYAKISYQVENLFTEAIVKEKEEIWMGHGRCLAAEKNLTSRCMGRLEVRITEFTVYDWFHLWSLDIGACRSAGVTVGGGMQEAFGEDLLSLVQGFPQENELKKRGMDIQPDIEVREYVPGDDLKSIHWKLTAKQGKTMVRERLAAGRDKINVLLPLTGDEQENDGLMEALQGLAAMLLDRGYPIRLCWLGRGNALISRYLGEAGELENALEEILSGSGKKDPDLARSRMEEEYPGEAYIAVRNGAYKGEYIR